MLSQQTTKWVENLDPSGSVVDAAKRSLKLRLHAVRDLLKHRPASGKNRSESIHQVRVASRRAQAAIELYSDLLPGRRVQWIAKQLKRLRKAAGPPRDLDVMTEFFSKLSASLDGSSSLFSGLERESRAAHVDFRDHHRKLRKKARLQRRLKSLPKRVDARHATSENVCAETFSNWSRTQLRHVVQEFFDAVPALQADADAVHQFRIRCKNLRYSVELVGSAFPSDLRDVAYPLLCDLQSILGEINDLTMASCYLTRQRSLADSSISEQSLRVLLEDCAARLNFAIAQFHTRWSNEFSDVLGECFEEMLADREETCESFR